jgi:hypothetical protein
MFEDEFLHFTNQVKDKKILFEAIKETRNDLKRLRRRASLLYLKKFEEKLK